MNSPLKNVLLRLHGFVSFDRSAKVRWLLTELGVPYQDKWVDRANKEHESADYLAINPMGRVPVLMIGDQPMIESTAICTYLADLHMEKGMAPALDSPLRPEYLQWIAFSAATLEPIQTRIMIIEDIPPGELYDSKFGSLASDLGDICVTLDRVLSRKKYLVGDRLSTADICVGYPIYFWNLWPELAAVVDQFPRVNEYIERLKSEPGAQKANVFSYKG